MNSVYSSSLRNTYTIVCGLLLCLVTLQLSATEGVDITTGGDWNTPSKVKPWSYDGLNRYGTAGYHFYNITEIGGEQQVNRPIDENLNSDLPAYIKAITPVEGSYTSHSFGYLAVDAPGEAETGKVESGLLAKYPNESGEVTELLTIQLKKIKNNYGVRIGVLVANADRKDISPAEVILSSQGKNWNRRVINLPLSRKGMWVFFNVPAERSNETLVLSIRPHSNAPAAIGGLVFDDLIVAPPQHPLNVISDEAVTQSGSATWKIAFGNETPKTTEDTWERALAMKLSSEYRQNEARITTIQNKLNRLPKPYTGEPTGTGGYLSHWLASSKNMITLSFRWEQPMTIDAVAFLPLRLFLADENGLTDNAYWPGSIQIHAINDDESILLQTITHQGRHIGQSLPALTTFEATTTQHLKITLTDLAPKAGGYQFAGGFSEICIFSEADNIAPQSSVSASSSREGYRVFSKTYLTDEQTPLGLPEVGPRTSGSLGLSIRTGKHTPAKPVDILLDFDEETVVDAVRIDPAVIYKPGQAFPIRFTIDLLEADGRVVHSDTTYKTSPLRNLGLNPYISHFPETQIKSVRLRIHEVSKPTELSRPWIQISEITPMLKGKHIRRVATVSGPNASRRSGTTTLFDPTGRRLYWKNSFAYDGQTQAGLALPLREWLEGLHARSELLKENIELEAAQQDTLRSTRQQALWAACLFLTTVVLLALFLLIRSKVNHRRALRSARERIASDLHDDVGSNLGTITLHTEFLMDQLETPSLIEHLKAITQLTRESVYGLREVLHTSAPRIGRAQNILHYMEELSQLVLPDVKLTMDLDPAANEALKSPERRKGILLYYKEAITNIRTHAECQSVSISLHKYTGYMDLLIKDDGVGMSSEQLSKDSTLRTLKLRAKQLNGTLNIITKVDKGTRLELRIPTRT